MSLNASISEHSGNKTLAHLYRLDAFQRIDEHVSAKYSLAADHAQVRNDVFLEALVQIDNPKPPQCQYRWNKSRTTADQQGVQPRSQQQCDNQRYCRPEVNHPVQGSSVLNLLVFTQHLIYIGHYFLCSLCICTASPPTKTIILQ